MKDQGAGKSVSIRSHCPTLPTHMFQYLDGESGGVQVNEVTADIQHVFSPHAVSLDDDVIQDTRCRHQHIALQPAQLLDLSHGGFIADGLNGRRVGSCLLIVRTDLLSSVLQPHSPSS